MVEKIKGSFKKTLIATGIILIIIVIISLIILLNDNLRFKFDYESLNNIPYTNGKIIKTKIPWKNNIKYIEGEEVIQTLKKETGIVYFGYPSCPWCRNIVGPLIEVAKENNLKIYYVNIHNAIEEEKEELKKLLKDYLRKNEETGEYVIAVPDVYYIKSGKIIGHHIGSVDSYKNPYKKMTEKQKKELKTKYQKLIKDGEKK